MKKPTSEINTDSITDVELELMPRAGGALIKFQPFLQVLEENEARALAMSVDVSMPPEERKRIAAEAKRLRLDCFAVARQQSEKCKTELKATVLEFGRAVDKANGEIWDRCEAVEKHLKAIEKFEENERLRIEEETRTRRAAEIAPFLNGPLVVDLGKISEEDYQRQLMDAKDLHALRLERERKEAEEAAAKAKAEAEERERLTREAEERRLEVERLKAEAKAKEEARLREVEQLRKEQAAREAKERKERERLAAEAQKEREARARLEQEARERQEAEQRQRENEEAERRRAAAAPDAEKLRAWAETMLALPLPELSPSAAAAGKDLAAKRQGFANWIDQLADGLGGVK